MRRFILTLSSSLMITGIFIMLVCVFGASNLDDKNIKVEEVKEENVPLGIVLLDEIDDSEVKENDKPNTYYKDILDHWAKDSIIKISNLGYVKGQTSEEFMPDKYVTRSEFITALAKMYGVNESGVTLFTDVSQDEEYYDYIAWAEYKGIVDTSSKKFYPEKEIIREEVAYMLVNYLKNVEDYIFIRGNNYSDEEEFSKYAIDSISYLRGIDIMTSKVDNKFMPKEKITKAELTVILTRILDKLGR